MILCRRVFMFYLDELYVSIKIQEKNKSIIQFKGDYQAWKQEKRRIRRKDRMAIKNAGKNILSQVSD